MNGKIKLLYIDDDAGNLSVFKAVFRKEYYVILANSADEGFEVLRNQQVHVVIADQRMPRITGVEFFESILKEFPEPMRILLTGYSDLESVIAAINKGQIYRYITKPWNEAELRAAIDNAFEMYDVRQKLVSTNSELRKRNDELNRFVYSASHELKAPLTTISGILKMTEENKNIAPEVYFNMIGRCVVSLDQFIKNIVDYYRNQKYENYRKEINFDNVVKELIQNYMFFENITDINFNININQTEPFVNDEFRVKVILNNILSNCIKYQKKENPDKRININIKTTSTDAQILFQDNGIGISQLYIDKIFNMFFRATDLGAGSGIGLYIVKEAVEKINGIIEVSSEEGNGSTFMIKIPNDVFVLAKQPM